MKHKETCKYEERIHVCRPGPAVSKAGSCACCYTPGYSEPQPDIFKSPFRSKWANTHTNEDLCDNCYLDVAGRHQGDPCMKSLKCLCSRRSNLEVLLVNR